MNVLDLFSGIGGFSLGLERAGMKTVAFCEIETYCRAVLKKHWPGVPCYDDIRTLTAERLAADGIAPIDVVCGGFPCQDISVAGKGAGLAGERSGLWKEYARLIGEIRPRFVLVENVAEMLNRGMGNVIGGLAALGYDAEWHCIPAAYVGAAHIRDRVWVIAYASGNGLEGAILTHNSIEATGCAFDWSAPSRVFDQVDTSSWETEPHVLGKDDDASFFVDRINALGNAVVPGIPEIIGRAIMQAENNAE